MSRIPKFVISVLALFATIVISFVPVAQAAKPVKIGFGMALTGGLALAGRAAVLAMKIWRDDVNKRGGLLGRKVELVYYDDKTKPAEVPAIYAKLIDVDKVDFVVSGYGTNLIVPAIPTVADRKMVFMTLFGLAANSKLKYRYYFQIMPAGPKPMTDWSNGYFEIAAKQKPKPKTIAFLAADAEFARNAVAGARQNAKKYGFKIVYDKTYPPKTADFTSTLRAIKAANADLVYIASYPPGSVGVTKAAKEIGLKPKLFGGTMVGLQYAAFLKNLGPMLNGMVNYDFWVPESTLDFPGIEEFLKKYQARAPKEKLDPLGHYLPPFAYSYVQILGQAIEATKSFDQKTVGEYIRTHEFTTVVGKVKFAPNGEWATTRMLMVQYQNIVGHDVKQFFGPGKRVVLYPKSVRSGNIIYPFPGFK